MNNEHVLLQIALRSWPFPQGAHWIIERLFSKLSFKALTASVRTTDGFDMKIMPNEHVGRYLYMTGKFDRTTFDVLIKHAKLGDTLLDIGANVGYASACFLAKVPGSRAIAVDPQPQVGDLLAENLRQFAERAKVVRVAISDKVGEGFLEINHTNRGASKLVDQASAATAKVELWSADKLIEVCRPETIDLIKIDVEGHEEIVFRALERTIETYRPRIIMFEDRGDAAAPTSFIGGLLRRLGYTMHGVKKTLTGFQLPSVKNITDCVFQDYVAILKVE